MQNITLAQLQKEKEVLSEAIHDLLKVFQSRTGLVPNVEVDSWPSYEVDKQLDIIHVSVEVKL